jgi:hypothetical protein
VNPYLIERPAVINFSGGRSSGFMLHKILESYGGNLPEDIKVIFCNTGLEHHETYEFIHRIGQEWCPVVWLEYTLTPEGKPFYTKVSYETASREGEPFTKLIAKKKYLPNPVARICTVNMKITTVQKYMRHVYGMTEWNRVLGLRSEETKRVSRMRLMEDVSMPMADAGDTKEDVIKFWDGHGLDLRLPLRGNILSNCVGCYLKSYQSLEEISRYDPSHFTWWIETEKHTGNRFRNDRPDYETIKANAHKQMAFDFGDTIDCFCTD